jgi:DNA-directed RNA polymerase subunit RPC12/RpoP
MSDKERISFGDWCDMKGIEPTMGQVDAFVREQVRAATPQVTPTDAAPAPQPPMDRLPLLVDAVQTFLKHDGGPGSEDYNASEIYHARRSMQAAFGFRCPRCGETLPHLYDENCTDYRATPQVTPTKYFATGYSREELKAMHPTIDLEPEWVKCPQCGRENSKETWQKFGGKCPNCNDLFDKESRFDGTSEPAAQNREAQDRGGSNHDLSPPPCPQPKTRALAGTRAKHYMLNSSKTT